jgi:tetratricopeptide (TPR) repeat protein
VRLLKRRPRTALGHCMLASLLLVLLIGSDALIDRNVVRDCAGANLDQALSACGRMIEVMPHSVRQVAVAYLYRGRAEYIRRQPQQAITDYSKAIAIDPRLAEAFSERGSAYLSLQRVDLAISDCTQAIQINPSNAAYRYNCGNAYWHGRHFDQRFRNTPTQFDWRPSFRSPT